MEISQMKLQQYLLTLKKYVRPKTAEPILQGIENASNFQMILFTLENLFFLSARRNGGIVFAAENQTTKEYCHIPH
jgi:hypothetical protein